eukprot:scaffold262153_cov15-Tisochrysis_lutea.AAC.1
MVLRARAYFTNACDSPLHTSAEQSKWIHKENDKGESGQVPHKKAWAAKCCGQGGDQTDFYEIRFQGLFFLAPSSDHLPETLAYSLYRVPLTASMQEFLDPAQSPP